MIWSWLLPNAASFGVLSLAGARGKLTLGACLTAMGLIEALLLFKSADAVMTLVLVYVSVVVLERIFEKESGGERRTAFQVAATVGPMCFFSLGQLLTGKHGLGFYSEAFGLASLSCIVCTASDTWSSVVGSALRHRVFSPLFFGRVRERESGAISWIGSLAGVVGAVLLSMSAMWFRFVVVKDANFVFWRGVGFVAGGAIVGNYIDSVLGFVAQFKGRCAHCGEFVETRTHCNDSVMRVRGYRWLLNAEVNLVSCVLAGVACYMSYMALLSN